MKRGDMTDGIFLMHIVDALKETIEFTKDVEMTEFLDSRLLVRAVTSSFEIAGEATKNLTKEFRDAHPEVKWREMAGFRDVLIHGYFGIDETQLWKGAKAALHDAKTGDTIWEALGDEESDMGRCMVADVDPAVRGCEMAWYGTNIFSCAGHDLGKGARFMDAWGALWFHSTLERQMLAISFGGLDSLEHGRIVSWREFDCSSNNYTKDNPCFAGDILGDWREEIILPTRDHNAIRIFSTWYPTEYRLPHLMTDHTYRMGAMTQNIGYNMIQNLGYYPPDFVQNFNKEE